MNNPKVEVTLSHIFIKCIVNDYDTPTNPLFLLLLLLLFMGCFLQISFAPITLLPLFCVEWECFWGQFNCPCMVKKRQNDLLARN